MARKLQVKKSEGIKPIPGEDVYPAKLSALEDGDGSFGEYLKLTFEITKDSTYAGEQRTILASKKLSRSPKGGSKLLNILEAVGGKKLQLDQEVDVDSFIGKECRILVAESPLDKSLNMRDVSKVLPKK